MTEKRFTIIETQIGKVIHDNQTDMNTGDICIILDLLNELNDENIELKHDNKRLVKFIMSKGYTLKDYLEWLQKEVWE